MFLISGWFYFPFRLHSSVAYLMLWHTRTHTDGHTVRERERETDRQRRLCKFLRTFKRTWSRCLLNAINKNSRYCKYFASRRMVFSVLFILHKPFIGLEHILCSPPFVKANSRNKHNNNNNNNVLSRFSGCFYSLRFFPLLPLTTVEYVIIQNYDLITCSYGFILETIAFVLCSSRNPGQNPIWINKRREGFVRDGWHVPIFFLKTGAGTANKNGLYGNVANPTAKSCILENSTS